MESKSVVTVSRKWNNPEIKVWVNEDEIGMSMSASDLLTAIAAEIGNPALIVTSAQLLAKMKSALLAVEDEIKKSSVTVL